MYIMLLIIIVLIICFYKRCGARDEKYTNLNSSRSNIYRIGNYTNDSESQRTNLNSSKSNIY